MEKSWNLLTAKETEALAAGLVGQLLPPSVIYLSGELGTGKTTFARGFIHALGYSGKVKSPTYTLVNEYPLDNFEVFHFDFYRITDAMEFETMGARDYFHERSVCLIEWPEKVMNLLPPADIKVHFSYQGDGRLVCLQLQNDNGMSLV